MLPYNDQTYLWGKYYYSSGTTNFVGRYGYDTQLNSAQSKLCIVFDFVIDISKEIMVIILNAADGSLFLALRDVQSISGFNSYALAIVKWLDNNRLFYVSQRKDNIAGYSILDISASLP